METAFNGIAGLEAYTNTKPDLVITDFMMPRMDGFKMVERIRQEDKFTPIIILDGVMGSLPYCERSWQLGAFPLAKPFEPVEPLQIVKLLLNWICTNRNPNVCWHSFLRCNCEWLGCNKGIGS